jgi:hypothetical protein
MDLGTSYGVRLNPGKSERATFAEKGRLIVVAES